jgi:lipid II:glycine glycyltransferase (peptidoglycan interpeptide bridge formation enzyme)
MIQQMIAYGRAQKVTSITIDSFYAQTAYERFEEFGFKTRGRWEFLLDLRPPEDKIWVGMDPHHKRYAKYGERQGLNVSEDNSSRGVDRLIELQQHARSRTQERGGDYDLPSYQAYLSLKAHLLDSGYGALFLAGKDGEAMSALLVSIYNNRAYLIFAGTNPEGYRLRAPIFLFWNTAIELKRRGIVEWNLGGVPREAEHETSQSHGLFKFKKRFGAKKVACVSAEMHGVNKPRALLYDFVRAIHGRG